MIVSSFPLVLGQIQPSFLRLVSKEQDGNDRIPNFRLQNASPQTNGWRQCGYVHFLCTVCCDNRWMYLVALRLDSVWPIKWKCFSFNTGWLQLLLTSLLLVKYKQYAVLYKCNIFPLFTLVGPSCWSRLEWTKEFWMNYQEMWHT